MSMPIEEDQVYELRSDVDARKTLVLGTSWRGIAELFRITWSSLILLILASLLGPQAFGLVGMTEVLVQFFNIFMEMGFETAIIQQEQINKRILSSLFWLNIALGFVLAGIGVLISPILAWFYQETQVAPIFSVLCITFILQSFSIVQRGLLARQMAFRTLALVDMAASFLASILAIVVAFSGGAFWSLVVLQLGKHGFTAVGYWYNSSWRPQFTLDIRASLSSIRFSGNVLLFNILNFLATRSDIILVGRLLGAQELGFYILANRLVFNPLGQVLNVVTATLLPVLSAVQHNIAQVRQIYVRTTVAVFTIVSPFIVLIALLSPLMIPFLLGPEWTPLVPVLIVWCIGGLRRMMTSRIGVIYLSMNRPDLQWKYQLISTPVVAAAVLMSAQWGVMGISINYNLAQLATSFISMYMAFPLIHLGILNYFKEYKKAVFALCVEVIAGLALLRLVVPLALPPYVTAGLIGLTVCPLYAATLYMIDPHFRRMWTEARSWLSKRYYQIT